jgi:hypothetical protein
MFLELSVDVAHRFVGRSRGMAQLYQRLLARDGGTVFQSVKRLAGVPERTVGAPPKHISQRTPESGEPHRDGPTGLGDAAHFLGNGS